MPDTKTMNGNSTQGWGILYGSEGFDQLRWRIVTDIRIRKFDRLNNVPEFYELPIELQNEIRTVIENINDYRVFRSEQYSNKSHAILFTNDNEKWMAIFQEKRLSINTRALFVSILICGLFYIWQVVKLRTSNTSKGIISYLESNLFQMALIIMTLALAFYLSRKWLSTRDSKYNALVEACMLEKLRKLTGP